MTREVKQVQTSSPLRNACEPAAGMWGYPGLSDVREGGDTAARIRLPCQLKLPRRSMVAVPGQHLRHYANHCHTTHLARSRLNTAVSPSFT
ncbi:hypothetical protein CNECB9_3330005 [Cupriavidus necator]|uniref:Uncharacterized protein n=1 Tax=Cupriavidus necator TaxID=106590 RepID=A0A1K0II44_CUPNE|nr:hypothetical protein CNECB9_3330005 [Cupriavidus necator]